MNTTGTLEQINDALKQALPLHPPSKIVNSPSIFEFERVRELELDWHDLTNSPQVDSVEDTFRDLKTYFETGWKQDAKDDSIFENEELFAGLKVKPYWSEGTIFHVTGAKEGSVAPAKVYESVLTKADNILYLIHKPSNRCFAFFDDKGKPMTAASLTSANDTNLAAWNNFAARGAVEIQTVHLKDTSTEKQLISHMEFVRRDALYFREEYKKLIAQIDFLKWINARIDGTKPPVGLEFKSYMQELLASKEDFDQMWLEAEYLENAASNFTNIKAREFTVREKIRQLAAKVKEYGYHLCLADETWKHQDGTTINVKEGEIYQIEKQVIGWSTQYVRYVNVKRKFLFMTYYERVAVRETQWHSTVIDNYIKVDFNRDPVQDLVKRLKEARKEVYTVTRQTDGFYTENGEAVANILQRCENSESFRTKCVIVIPEYDFIVTNNSYYVGAFVFYNPLPGMVPVRYPVVGFREELSYRMVWEGTELGQLVSSINLAPGETRSINISSKFAQTTSQTSSFKSMSDLSTSEGFDLSTEFQTEASRELTRTSSFSASASGSGGIGPFSASASASGSRSTSLKNFSREMNKVAKKVSRNINRKLSQEVTSTSSTSTQVTQESTKSMQITNINQGSTLNLLFYQINNRFDSGLFMVDLEITVGSPTELIAGSGIFETKSYRLHELQNALAKLHPKLLPGEHELGDPAVASYYHKLLIEITKTINQDYIRDIDLPGLPPPPVRASSANLITLDVPVDEIKEQHAAYTARNQGKDYPGYLEALLSTEKKEIGETELKALFDKLVGAFRKKKILDNPMGGEILIIPSGGLYVDSIVGSNPATEKYSEQMRALESQRVLTEIQKQDALNEETRARVNFMLKGDTFITQIFSFSDIQQGGNLSYYVVLQLSKAVDDKEWSIFYGNEIRNFAIELKPSKNVLQITWLGPPPPTEALESKLYLMHKTKGTILRKL
jgi:hypothetical protein